MSCHCSQQTEFQHSTHIVHYLFSPLLTVLSHTNHYALIAGCLSKLISSEHARLCLDHLCLDQFVTQAGVQRWISPLG